MAEKKKILVVEDFDDSRQFLALYLRRLGYDVLEASDGIQGLEKVAAVSPDLIVMDLSMARMDGVEATSLLKANPKTRDIPVLAVTAHTQKALYDSALSAGAAEVLFKPLTLSALKKTIERYLRNEEKPTISTSTSGG